MSASPYKTTVSAEADSRDLTLLATVKTELGITTTENDAYLATLITQASQIVASYCNRQFQQETLIDYFRLRNEPRCTDLLLLSRFPIASISSVVEDGETLTTDDYEFEAESGFLYRLTDDERTSWARAKILVTHISGYELLDTLPQDVERACVMLVVQNFRSKGRDPALKSEEVPGVQRFDYWVGSAGENGALAPEVTALLDRYRVIPI